MLNVSSPSTLVVALNHKSRKKYGFKANENLRIASSFPQERDFNPKKNSREMVLDILCKSIFKTVALQSPIKLTVSFETYCDIKQIFLSTI